MQQLSYSNRLRSCASQHTLECSLIAVNRTAVLWATVQSYCKDDSGFGPICATRALQVEEDLNLRQALKRRIRSNKALLHYSLKCYALAHPPPHRRANMEFEADAWNGVSSLHYQGGRMLGEDNSGPYPFREITHNRYETCPFMDTRLGLPMNVTNLELVLPYAADAYRLTTVLRNRYIAHRSLEDTRFNLVQSYLFSKFSVSIPAFLVRRKDRPIQDGGLEPLEAAFYMLGAAPFILIRQLIARGDRSSLSPEPKSGEALYDLSSESRTLISNRECACPASPKLIAGYFDVIMNGSYRGALEAPAVDRVFERIGDWQSLYEYTLAASRVDLLVLLSKAVTLRSLRQLRRDEALFSAEVIRDIESRLFGPLTLSYVGAPDGPHKCTALDAVVESFSALLRDHGDMTTPDEIAKISTPTVGDSPSMSTRDVARRIRESSDLILRSCLRDLQSVHVALGTRHWPAITFDDVLRRTGGPSLLSHLDQLEAAKGSRHGRH